MNMKNNKLNEQDMKDVSGGTAASETNGIIGIIGMENFDVEQKKCARCGSDKLIYRTFLADDGVTTKIGQLCGACGQAWTIGNKTGIK